MLTRLNIRNFKGWKKTGDIRLAPLTLLFGGNSAGKTSISQLLLLLKQTARSPDRRQVLNFGDANTLIDLGTFQDVIHAHDIELPLEFELEWRTPGTVEISDPLKRRHRCKGDTMAFEATIRHGERQQNHVERMRYELRRATETREITEQVLSAGLVRRQDGHKYDLETEGYSAIRTKGRAWKLPAPHHFYGFPDEAVAYYQNTGFLNDLTLAMQVRRESILHGGPQRGNPHRHYTWSGEEHTHVGPRGERAVDAILAAQHRRYNFGPKQLSRPSEQVIAERLKRMNLIHKFEVKPIAPGRKEYEVLLKTHAGMPEVKLTDVGIGVSQVLPVVVECFSVPPGSIVIFEQPELHLHPQMQADLADVFIDAIRAREKGKPRDIQFIIESHSEHFLRRLQRRIAEDPSLQQKTAMYFVDVFKGRSRLQPLEVDPYGNILNWPEAFFGDEMEDLVARSKAQAKRLSEGEA